MPLVAMPSRPLQPDLYCNPLPSPPLPRQKKERNHSTLHTLKIEKLPKMQVLYIHTNTVYKLNSEGGWVGRSLMAGPTKVTACLKVT